MTEREDAAVEDDQLASRNPTLDQSHPKPSGNQLPMGDYPVLLLGQASHHKGCFVPRRNVLSPRWGVKALHLGRAEVRRSSCNAFSPSGGDKTLRLGVGGLGHDPTVPGDGARVARRSYDLRAAM